MENEQKVDAQFAHSHRQDKLFKLLFRYGFTYTDVTKREYELMQEIYKEENGMRGVGFMLKVLRIGRKNPPIHSPTLKGGVSLGAD